MTALLGLLLAAAPANAGAVWTLVMPFGLPQFTHERPGRGAIYLGSQLAMGGLATWSSIELWEAAEAEDFDRELRHRMISAGAVAGVCASWLVSVIDGARLHQLEVEGVTLSQAPHGRASWSALDPFAAPAGALPPGPLALAPAADHAPSLDYATWRAARAMVIAPDRSADRHRWSPAKRGCQRHTCPERWL